MDKLICVHEQFKRKAMKHGNGYCHLHGEKRKCTYPQCSNYAESHGVCVQHGYKNNTVPTDAPTTPSGMVFASVTVQSAIAQYYWRHGFLVFFFHVLFVVGCCALPNKKEDASHPTLNHLFTDPTYIGYGIWYLNRRKYFSRKLTTTKFSSSHFFHLCTEQFSPFLLSDLVLLTV